MYDMFAVTLVRSQLRAPLLSFNWQDAAPKGRRIFERRKQLTGCLGNLGSIPKGRLLEVLVGWKYDPDLFKHRWEMKIAQPVYNRWTGATEYPHPARTRLGDHCVYCGEARDFYNQNESCPERGDMSSPHFVWPEWEPEHKE